MSFRDEMVVEINEKKKKEKQKMIDGTKNREKDIDIVVSHLIYLVKESFKKAQPEKEFRTNWIGKKICTGKIILRGRVEIKEVIPKCKNYNKIEHRECETGYDTDTWYYDVIYADEEDIEIIKQKVCEWIHENDIEIDYYKNIENGGFVYALKIYIDND